MSAAIGLALLSMVFTGIIDVLYRLFAVRSYSRGMFLATMGAVWGTLQLVVWQLTDPPIAFSAVGLGFGLLAGAFLTVSNVSLIEALAHVPVSLGSTVYRLNTVGVVLLAWLLLDERMTVEKLAGIGCGVAAVLLLYERRSTVARAERFGLFCAVAVVASMMRASYGVASKAGLSGGASAPELMVVGAGCWVVGGVAYAAIRERTVALERHVVGMGALAGLVAFAIVNTLVGALTLGDASVVVPISNLGFLTALAISVAVGWEPIGARKVLAAVMAVLAIALLAGWIGWAVPAENP